MKRLLLLSSRGKNLFGNADFEAAAVTPWGQSSSVISVSSAQKHSGTQSALATATGTGGGILQDVSIDIVKPGRPYVIGIWVYNGAAATRQLRIRVNNVSGGGYVQDALFSIPNGVWTFAQRTLLNYTTYSNTTVRFLFTYNDSANTELFYFDDATLREGSVL